jgi:FKBP-type peptidyl-prolyl cis-trans isomerase
MKKLSRNESIGVFVAIIVTGFILFGGQFLNLFAQNDSVPTNTAPIQTGVKVENIVNGTGTTAEKGDLVTVDYIGALTDGKVFDSSIDRKQPFTFQLGVGQVIRGWDEGVVGMNVGGKRRLTIGSDYGYGAQAVNTIPPNSTLVFEVQLLKVEKPTTK